MTPTMIKSASLEDRVADTIGPGRVVAALFSTFTFGREFFERVPLSLITDEGRRRGFVPITVVVDPTQYKGNGSGYEVKRAPGGRRWHAKLIAAMIEEDRELRTVVAIGSGNLTQSGWERNLELFHVDSWSGWRLPTAVVAWLRRPWLHASHFAKWAREKGVVTKRRYHQSVLGSIAEPLWHQLDFVRRGRRWSEIQIVSPFGDVDGDEAAEADACGPFFEHVLDHAVMNGARMTVYLRETDKPGTAYGDPGLLKRVGSRVNLRLRAVPSDDNRILHAKLLAARTDGKWSVVMGSPNATGPGFVTPKRNVELACEFPYIGRVLPPGLLPRSRAIGLADVVPPQLPKPKERWECLESASYEPRRKRIVLRWKNGHSLSDSRVLLEGRDLDAKYVDLGTVKDRFLETVPLGAARRKYEPDYVPIEVPDDEADLLHDMDSDRMTAEDWLASLDSSPALVEPSKTGARRTGSVNSRPDGQKSHRFHWRERVVMLTEKLRGFDAAIDDAITRREVDHLRKMALGVWRSHNPDEGNLSSVDCAWRDWVRAGLWQVLRRVDQRIALRRPLSNLARRWGRAVPRLLREFEIA